MRVPCLTFVYLACVGNTEADSDVTRRGYGKAVAQAFVPTRTLPVSASTAASPDATSNALSQQIDKLELQNDAIKVDIERLHEQMALGARKKDEGFGSLTFGFGFLVGLAASVGLSAAAINKFSGNGQGSTEPGSSSQLVAMPQRTGPVMMTLTPGLGDGRFDPLGLSIKVSSQRAQRNAELMHGRTAMGIFIGRSVSPAMQFFDPKKDKPNAKFEKERAKEEQARMNLQRFGSSDDDYAENGEIDLAMKGAGAFVAIIPLTLFLIALAFGKLDFGYGDGGGYR